MSIDSADEVLQKIKNSIQEFLSTSEQTKNGGKSESTLIDVGDLSTGENMIKISRRNAYLSSEGTTVIPPVTPTRQLLELFSKSQAEAAAATADKQNIVQLNSINKQVLNKPDEL